jgi:2-oxoisovalerate dehydrogenase E1 component
LKRYPPFDPPEYIDWAPDPALVEAYRARVGEEEDRRAIIAALDDETLLTLYRGMVRFRLHDISLKRWVRQGVISKAWLATGEEAVTIGAVHALDRSQDVVTPMIRNAGALHEMGVPLARIFRGYLASATGPNGGRDGHFGDLEHGVLQPVSHVGDMVPVTTGMALAFQRRGEPRVALTWIGDGGTKTGAFHEGVNLGAVLGVPAVYIIENNQVALGTRLDQHQVGDFSDWPAMYGMAGAWADGNHVLDVYAAVKLAADRARAGDGPTLLVVDTFRMGGHATHDEKEARETFPAELFERWGKRDPIGLYEEYLMAEGVADREALEAAEAEVSAELEAAVEEALAARHAEGPAGESAEYPGVSAGVRQPGLAARLDAGS